MILHWNNQYVERDCDSCNLHQCKAVFHLGVEDKTYNDKGELIQTGVRYEVNECLAKDKNKYAEHLNFFYNVKRWGLPYSWIKLPKVLFDILNVLENEREYLRA